jgi:hypothetical protein
LSLRHLWWCSHGAGIQANPFCGSVTASPTVQPTAPTMMPTRQPTPQAACPGYRVSNGAGGFWPTASGEPSRYAAPAELHEGEIPSTCERVTYSAWSRTHGLPWKNLLLRRTHIRPFSSHVSSDVLFGHVTGQLQPTSKRHHHLPQRHGRSVIVPSVGRARLWSRRSSVR